MIVEPESKHSFPSYASKQAKMIQNNLYEEGPQHVYCKQG